MTVIFSSGLEVFLKGNTDTSWLKYQSENGHYIDLESSPFMSVSLFKLGFQFPIVEREWERVTSNSQTWQSLLFLTRGSHWFFLHFTISLVEKRWLWVLRQLMMWFVTVDHRWAERIALTLWQVTTTVFSIRSHKINSGGSTDNLHWLKEYFLCQPHCSHLYSTWATVKSCEAGVNPLWNV